jgi:hypothetical protein
MGNADHRPRSRTEAVGADERWAMGRTLRKSVPRSSHGEFTPAAGRPDPVTQLQAQATDRLPDLLPVRYRRMATSPFAFLRGSATVMSKDLAGTPATGLSVQLCGDAHLANFGVFASPERTLVFDVNDFDETLPGPWEWDVKRLAASLVVAGRVASFSEAECRRCAIAAARMYRQRIIAYAGMRHREVWYDQISVNEVLSAITAAKKRRGVKRIAAKARGKDHLRAYQKLTGQREQLVAVDLLAAAGHDERHRLFAHHTVWPSDNSDLEQGRVGRQNGLDLARRNILAASADEVLLAIHQNQISIVVEVPDIAGV